MLGFHNFDSLFKVKRSYKELNADLLDGEVVFAYLTNNIYNNVLYLSFEVEPQIDKTIDSHDLYKEGLIIGFIPIIPMCVSTRLQYETPEYKYSPKLSFHIGYRHTNTPERRYIEGFSLIRYYPDEQVTGIFYYDNDFCKDGIIKKTDKIQVGLQIPLLSITSER